VEYDYHIRVTSLAIRLHEAAIESEMTTVSQMIDLRGDRLDLILFHLPTLSVIGDFQREARRSIPF
jgi:hypothetical protein